MNRNVRLVLTQCFLIEAARYLICRGIVAAYVLLLTKDNVKVGWVTGVGGIVQLFAAVPAGWMADKPCVGRQGVLRAAASASLPAAALTNYCLLYLRTHVDSNAFYLLLVASQCLWGLHIGVQSPAVEAIFGDSVQSGSRSSIYQTRLACRFLGQATGPALAVIVFLVRGDKWTVEELTIIQTGATAVFLLSSFCLLMMRDSKSLGAESEALGAAPSEETLDADLLSNSDRNAGSDRLLNAQLTPAASADGSGADGGGGRGGGGGDDRQLNTSTTRLPPLPPIESNAASAAAQSSSRARCVLPFFNPLLLLLLLLLFSFLRPLLRYVPFVIGASDIVAMLASGMSVQFFPLFFWRAVNLSPTGVYLVASLSFAAVTPFALTAQRASLCLGRVCVSILYNLCGVSLLLLMAYWRELGLPHALVSVAYVVRTGFMNSTGGECYGIPTCALACCRS